MRTLAALAAALALHACNCGRPQKTVGPPEVADYYSLCKVHDTCDSNLDCGTVFDTFCTLGCAADAECLPFGELSKCQSPGFCATDCTSDAGVCPPKSKCDARYGLCQPN